MIPNKKRNGIIFSLCTTCLLLIIALGAVMVGIIKLPAKYTCRHEEWDNGVCLGCGKICSHRSFEEGVCTACGYVCPHSAHDEFGICVYCGGDCQHLRHDPDDLYCLKCGKRVRHDFITGTCPICGKTAEIEEYCLDQFFWQEPPEAGDVVTAEYETRDYTIETEDTVLKQMQIYLPYGYSREKQYNVLVLIHGSGGRETYWFSEGHIYTYPSDDYVDTFSFTRLLDNMIYYRYCEPLIVVSPTYYLNDDERARGDVTDRDISQLRFELQKDILPYVVDNYSTFAESSSYAGLCASRDHFGFIGASYGAFLACESILHYDEDMIAWFGAISGTGRDISSICSYLINNTAYDGKNVMYFYSSAGELEDSYESTFLGYTQLIAFSDRIGEDNSLFVTVKNACHECRVWDNGVYNCLLKFFKGQL